MKEVRKLCESCGTAFVGHVLRPRCDSCRRERERQRERSRHRPEKREYDRKRYQRDAERVKARVRAYREANPEKIRERKRRDVRENRERVRATQRRWRAANAEKMREFRRQWAQAHPEKARQYANERRARKARAKGAHSEAEFAALVEWCEGRCAYCGQVVASPTRDHLVPLSRGGTDSLSNLVPACKPCNSRKGTKTVEEFLGHISMEVAR